MKVKMELTHTVTLVIEGDNLDEIQEWANERTPSEALDDAHKLGNFPKEDWEENYICTLSDNAKADVKI